MGQSSSQDFGHDHVFLTAAHEAIERRTWAVIGLCSAMMVGEIVGGALFGSIALVADGLHMSTHAGAMLLAALAYTFSRKHAKPMSSPISAVSWRCMWPRPIRRRWIPPASIRRP